MNRNDRKPADGFRRDQVARRAGAGLQMRYDRALALARGCEAIGDRVEAERFYQQADHLRRLLNSEAA